MKKLINEPQHVVDDMLEGIVRGSEILSLIPDVRVVVRSDLDAHKMAGKVALISGGGAGHEPAHAGYIGQGMLTAAVSGAVFASPSVDQVLAAIRLCATPRGVLLIVKNYTGDRLNFGLAAEIAKGEGIDVEMVVVGDDVALEQDANHAGRRGLAGTIFVHKVAGAAAEQGMNLQDVAAIAQEVAKRLSTMSVGLGPCVVPGDRTASFELADNEIEWGLGIHGEAGTARTQLVTSVEAVERLAQQTMGNFEGRSERALAVMLNNLGGTSNVEMGVVAKDLFNETQRRGLSVERFWSGTFMTAMEMPGISITALDLSEDPCIGDSSLIDLLDAPSKTLAWPSQHAGKPRGLDDVTFASQVTGDSVAGEGMNNGIERNPEVSEPKIGAVPLLRAVIQTLKDSEPELTEMDRIVGDGDLGQSLSRAAQAIEVRLDELSDDPVVALRDIATTVRSSVGGTSGPLYSIALFRAAAELERQLDELQLSETLSLASTSPWAKAFDAAVSGIEDLGGARIGDCTMVDALRPAADALTDAARQQFELPQALAQASERARSGAEFTGDLIATKGRSSYLGERAIGQMDPGAWAVYLWLTTLAEASSDLVDS